MGKGPWERPPESEEKDSADKEPPDFSGFVLIVIGFVLLAVAAHALLNWKMPDLTPDTRYYSTRRMLLHNPFIALVMIGLVLLVAQFIKKK